MNLYTDVNLKQNEVQFAVIHPLANAPSGVEGQVYYNTTDDTLYMHDGTQWKPVGVRYEIEYGQATDSIALNLVGSDGNTDTVYLKGAGGATLSVNGDTLTITSKDYPIGTKSQLETGTSQSESVWTPEILHDYVMDRIGEIPADQFLDLNKTEFVQNFSWSAVLYPGSTDPNLDGKPVLVLALTDGDTTAYSFLNMESLISAYTGTAPINVNGSNISLNDSGATAGSFGDANNMTPSWGESFKALFATINSKGLATLVSEHNVTIPDTVASATSKGLMSAEDKQKLDLLNPISYNQVTGKPTSDQEPDFGDTVTVSQISQASSGQVSALDRTIKIPDTLASDTNDGLMSAEDKDKLDNVDDIYNTECGDIVTIDDAQSDSDVTSLQVTLEPVQDNDYDSVWTGGNGKNKLKNTLSSTTYRGVTFTVNSDGSITANGTATGGDANVGIPIDTSKVYGDLYFNAAYNGSDATYNAYVIDQTAGGRAYQWNGTTRSINGYKPFSQVKIIQGNTVILYVRVMNGQTVNNLTFYPMICESTETNTDFEPYSNICPITGHDSVGANVTGINQWDEEWEVGGYSETTGQKGINNGNIRSKNYFPVLPNTSYHKTILATGQRLRVFYYDGDKNYIDFNTAQSTFTTPANCYYMTLGTIDSYGDTYNNDISINYPATDHDYHAYTGSTYTATLPQTVYGGDAELVGGTGKSERVLVTYDGSADEEWTLNGSQGVYIFVPQEYRVSSKPFISNKYPVFAAGQATILPYGQMCWNSAYTAIQIKDSRGMDVASFRALLAENPLEVLYWTKTPTDLSFTPQSITLNEGTNNVWSEQGDVCVSYLKERGELGEFIADTQRAIKDTVRSIQVTLESANWSNNTQAVTVEGVDGDVIIAPDPASLNDYVDAGIVCTAQGVDSLTFTCDTTPTTDITVNILIMR